MKTYRTSSESKRAVNSFLLFTFIFSLLCVGCNNIDDTQPADTRTAARLSATITRASGTAWAEGDAVGVYMKTCGETLSAAAIVDGADNLRHAVAPTDGRFTATADIYFPIDDSAVDFVAYYPYAASVTDYLYPIDLSSQDDLPAIDLLYSDNAAGKTAETPQVALTFTHKLVAIEVALEAGNCVTAADLDGLTIELTNQKPTGTMNLATGEIAPTEGVAAATLTMNLAGGTPARALIMPTDDAAGCEMVFTLSTGEKFVYILPSATAFVSGTRHLYKARINRTGVEVSSSVTDWTVNNNSNDPMVLEPVMEYKVGDYYPDPTNASTAEGVVFWVGETDADGPHGKIVSPDEGQVLMWNAWAGNYGATSASDGATNTAAIATIIANNSSWPAFEAYQWCVNKGTGWYFPAIDELTALYVAYNADRTAFDAKLTAAGGEAISDNDYDHYWSSTEFSDSNAWYISFADGNSNRLYKKNAYKYVRAAKAI